MASHRKSSLSFSTPGCASRLKLLADPTRLAVLERLLSGPLQVNALADRLGVEQSLLSHHLQKLRAAGFVETRREGKAVVYRLADGLRGEAGAIDLGCCTLEFAS